MRDRFLESHSEPVDREDVVAMATCLCQPAPGDSTGGAETSGGTGIREPERVVVAYPQARVGLQADSGWSNIQQDSVDEGPLEFDRRRRETWLTLRGGLNAAGDLAGG